MESEYKVILLEDDKTLVSALTAVFERDGIQVFSTSDGDEALDLLKKHRILTIFVDCLLPSQSGVDFVHSIRKQFSKEILDVVMMSGVFTEPSFIRDTLRETDAVSFLRKPFANEEILKLVRKPTKAEEKTLSRKSLYSLFQKASATAAEKRQVISQIEGIHGFDLPLIYGVLVEARMSGHLNIVSDFGDVWGISFSDGTITAVDVADQETVLGKLLIESGFLLPEDLDLALKMRSPLKLGERLIQENLVSPHGFDIVLSHQMSIRLSRTIVDQKLKVNFVERPVPMTTPHIDSELFQKFQHDWIAAKIHHDWLRASFTPWMQAKVIKTSQFEQRKNVLRMPLALNTPRLEEAFTGGKTLGELIDSKKWPEDTFLKALYFCLTRGIISFESNQTLKPEDQLKLLRTLAQQFTGRNRLEIYDRMARITGTSETQPQVVYSEFLSLLGSQPPKDPEGAKIYAQLQQVAKGSFEYAQSGNHDKLKEEILKSDIEMKLKASAIFEEARNCLQKAQYREAMTLLQKAEAADPKLERIRLHMAWAKLGTYESSKNKIDLLREIEMDLLQVAPEDKFDSLFSFVSGLFAKHKGDIPSARRALEKAIAMDGGMIVARRELTMLSSMNTGRTDLLNADLKTLVGNLFQRKTK